MRRTYFWSGPLPDRVTSGHVTLPLPVKRPHQGGYDATSGCACAEHTSGQGYFRSRDWRHFRSRPVTWLPVASPHSTTAIVTWAVPICYFTPSCGTVALMVLYIFFFADHRTTVFTLSTTFETAQKKSCVAFLPIFVMKSGARTIKHIYFVSLDIYLHSSILTYLLIFISSSLS